MAITGFAVRFEAGLRSFATREGALAAIQRGELGSLYRKDDTGWALDDPWREIDMLRAVVSRQSQELARLQADAAIRALNERDQPK